MPLQRPSFASKVCSNRELYRLLQALTKLAAIWFSAQCFGRLGQRIGTSLLELNTLGHALVALLIYCLWWNKPLDTKEPEQIVLRGNDELGFFAYLCASSTLDHRQAELHWLNPPDEKPRGFRFYIPGASGEELGRRWEPRDPMTRGCMMTWPVRHQVERSMIPEWLKGFPLLLVISSGSGSRKWLVGLGVETVSATQGEILWTEGSRYKS